METFSNENLLHKFKQKLFIFLFLETHFFNNNVIKMEAK